MPEEEKVKKLDRLLSLLDPENALSKKDFASAFAKVLDLVQNLLENHSKAIANLQEQHQQIIQNIKEEYGTNFHTLKNQVDHLFVGDQLKRMDSETKFNFSNLQFSINAIVEEKLKEIDNRVSKIKDGYTPIKGKDYFDGRHGTEITAEQILNKIKGLLNIDSIKDLRKVLNKMAGSRSLGMKKITSVRSVDLTADVNGSAVAFTLPADTLKVLGVYSTQFPITFRDGVDWTFSGRTLTLITRQVGTPQIGQTLWALIETAFYA